MSIPRPVHHSRCSLFCALGAALALSGCGDPIAADDEVQQSLYDRGGVVSPDQAPIDLAVIGDSPYGAAQLIDFPNLVGHINADLKVRRVVHVGDIKNGSTRCDTSYFHNVASLFQGFADPLVFTPGDNEWTDCHRANNGAYDPLERLAVLRQTFYPQPGEALGGRNMRVFTQADVPGFEAFVENQMWLESTVAFGLVHVVGSNNGRARWFGDDMTGTKFDDPIRREAEVAARIAAATDWLERLFALATAENAAGVAVIMQADTWTGTARDGFTAVVRRLADLSRAFPGPVLLVQGDSHRYKVDAPLAAGDAGYGVVEPVANLTRLVVEGETTREWLRLQVRPRQQPLFSWQRVIR